MSILLSKNTMTTKIPQHSNEEPVPYLSDEEFDALEIWEKLDLAEKRKRWINGILTKKAKANKITKEEIIQELKKREELDRIRKESRNPFAQSLTEIFGVSL